MQEVICIYVFYIDVFLEQNFLMNLIVLSITHIFCKRYVRFLWLRMAAAALLGSILSLAFYLLVQGYAFAVSGIAFFVVPLMLFLAFGRCPPKLFILQTGASWLSIVLLNGVVTAVYNLTGIQSLYIYVCVLVLFITRVLVRMLVSSVNQQKNQMQVTLTYHGRSVTCMGLYDSGNMLCMPGEREAVHIISPAVLKQVLKEDEPEFQFIPFHALGTREGWIYVCRLDALCIEDERCRKVIKSPWVGRAEDGLLYGKSYQVILNSAVVDNE